MHAVARNCTVATLAARARVSLARAGAADWEFNPDRRGGLSVRRQLPADARRAPRSTCRARWSTPQLELRTLTQTGEFSFTPRVRATYFPDETDLDTVDYFGTLDWQHRGQRVDSARARRFRAAGHRQQRAARCRTSGGDLGEPDFGDCGPRARATTAACARALRPVAEFELSPRRELQFDASYTDVSFDERSSDAQVDYNTRRSVRRARVDALNERIIADHAPARRALRHRHAGRHRTPMAPSCSGIRATPRTRATYLRAGAQNVELVDGGNRNRLARRRRRQHVDRAATNCSPICRAASARRRRAWS